MRVAIVGVGGVFPAAPAPERLWENILARVDASREPPPGRWLLSPDEAFDPTVTRPDKVYSRRACFLEPCTLDPVGLAVSPDLLAGLDPVFHLALHAGRQAWKAGVTASLDRRRVGVILGSIALPTEKASALARHYLGPRFFEKHGIACPVTADPLPHPVNSRVTCLPAALLAQALGLGGGSYTLDAACASSLYAIKLAIDELAAGRADAVLAGGLSRPDSLYTQMGFSQLRALSPSGRCSPFDVQGDGLVVGEGAGIFLLKRLDDALEAGDSIVGVIVGMGLSNDVGGGLLAPASEGQLRALHAAYQQAGWRPEAVDLIECHATGTPIGDAVEVRSLKALWQGVEHRPGQCVIGSVKSTVGHLLTGAGAAALTKVLYALHHGVLPPTANFEKPAPGLELEGSPFRVLRQSEPWPRRPGQPRRAAVSAFGFGGINAHLLIEEAPIRGGKFPTCRFLPSKLGNLPGRNRQVGNLPGRNRQVSNLPGRNRQVGNLPPRKRDEEPEIAIIALAAHFAAAPSVEAMRRQLLGAAPPRPAGDRFVGHSLDQIAVAAERFRIPPREIEEMLPQQALLLQVASDALREAGLDDGSWPRAGVFVGLGLDLNTTNFHFRWSVLQHAPSLADAAGPSLSANRTMGALASIAASRIAREFRFGGPSFTVSCEETSGLRALALAAEALQRVELDHALVGAVDLACDIRTVLARERLSADGAPPGDGAVVLVLKRLDDALRDGNTIHAVIQGIGSAGGAICLPDVETRTEAIRRAHAAAGIDPRQVDHTESHDSVKASLGHTGSAAGLAALARACLCLRERVLPGPPRPWLRDRSAGPRMVGINALGLDGNCMHVLLRESPVPLAAETVSIAPMPLGESLFVVEGQDAGQLLSGLQRLPDGGMRGKTGDSGLAISLVARDRDELLRLIAEATRHLQQLPDQPLPAGAGGPFRERIFYSPRPLGPVGQIAFVYPGSGNDFAGMGREIALRWPGILRKQDEENRRLASQYLPEKFWADPPVPASVQERIFSQVALGSLTSDLLGSFGVKPHAAIGYSLGESAALFALRAWTDRDRMLEAMNASPLFVSDLTGRCEAARQAWGRPAGTAIDWRTGIVERSAAEVRAALAGLERAYLQIINTPSECVIGGEQQAVEQLVRRLGAPLVPIPETTTMHCEVVRVVADAYHALHRLPTTPPAGIRFYSSGLGRAYNPSPDTVADAILLQALETVDFPAVIGSAYRDGVRLFVEMGPGASCTRMIGAILGERPHRARSACGPGADGLSALWRTLALLVSERVPVDLAAVFGPEPVPPAPMGRMVVVPVGAAISLTAKNPSFSRGSQNRASPSRGSPARFCEPRLNEGTLGGGGAREKTSSFLSTAISDTAALQEARSQAHGAWLRMNASLQRTVASTLAFQGQLFEALLTSPLSLPAAPVALNREHCLEFAIGSIARVLGPDFTEADTFPTRVRLPDEPLMLVDRILTIEGVSGSLTRGRVVTEHDVHANAWYLDCGRIPTCIAVEAGQADLFLSGYLGIDSRTRGLAVYRLLDAAVTFHCGLPGPGEGIRYDIHIDRFFRQGDTWLFHFRFVGTVNGEPLLTMTDGCAGFFSEAELTAGKGVVHTAFQRAGRPGVQPDDAGILPHIQPESYDESQVDALRRGDLGRCFGPLFARLPLRAPMCLPGGRMRLVHRVTRLDPQGGRFGIGQIQGEADIHPDDWFLECHFIDDQVMPGTLMYECCLHTLRIFLMRLGWVGEQGQVVCEPIPGVVSRLKCRGQVIASTRTVTYEVTLKERGYRPEPYAIVDALMYADGKAIVDITDMSIRLSGLTREGIAAMWAGSLARRPALFDTDRILAFATGKPSAAFGEPYRIFDADRVIARLPGPPFQFLDRIVAIDAQPWQMVAGGIIEAEYDVPADAWYFTSQRAALMPFAVLLETALQPCGWLAAYLGSALTSPIDLRFRNLGGSAELLRPVTPLSGTLTTKVRITRVASSAGMIIQEFDFDLGDEDGSIYRGSTTFGFFTAAALAQQVGLREERFHEPTPREQAAGQTFDYPRQPPYPDTLLGMIDRIDLLVADGGPHGLGLIQGSKTVQPREWFFKAHFYQDPVMPGSLGLESCLQLLMVLAAQRWQPGPDECFAANIGGRHRWTYRGQVVPTNRTVAVHAIVTASDEQRRELTADGLLAVDGLVIYRMKDFKIRVVKRLGSI